VRGVSSPLGPVTRSAAVHEGGAGRVLHIPVPVGLVARGVGAMARGIRAVGRSSIGAVAGSSVRTVARGSIRTVAGGSIGAMARGVGAVGGGSIRTVARGVGARVCSIRMPAAVRISVGSIVVGAVRGRSVGGRSIGAVAVSGGVRRSVVSTIVGRGIAAVSTVGIGGHHGRLAGVATHMHLLVICAPLVLPIARSVSSISITGSVPSITVSRPISVSTIGRISVSTIGRISISTVSAVSTVASITAITTVAIMAVVGSLYSDGQNTGQQDMG